MGETSKIPWTDATVNFWWGCTKVGPGCDHCYAEKWDARTGGAHWGVGVPRRKIGSAAKLIHKLDNAAPEWLADAATAIGNARAFGLPVPTQGKRRRVFIQSMSDLFDLEVPLDWFIEAWQLIRACNRLAIQIVTKRVSAVEKRINAAEFTGKAWPRHVGLIATVVDHKEAERDVPRLLALKAKLHIPWVGLSIEPMLGPIDLTCLSWQGRTIDAFTGLDEKGVDHFSDGRNSGIDWVICGGESKQGKDHQPRPFDLAWARLLRDQCAAAGTAFFIKQMGACPIVTTDAWPGARAGKSYTLHLASGDRANADPRFWPEDLRVRQFPPQLMAA